MRQGEDSLGHGINHSPEFPSVHNFQAETKWTQLAFNHGAHTVGAVGAEYLNGNVLVALAGGEFHGTAVVQNDPAVRVRAEYGAADGRFEGVPLNQIEGGFHGIRI